MAYGINKSSSQGLNCAEAIAITTPTVIYKTIIVATIIHCNKNTLKTFPPLASAAFLVRIHTRQYNNCLLHHHLRYMGYSFCRPY